MQFKVSLAPTQNLLSHSQRRTLRVNCVSIGNANTAVLSEKEQRQGQDSGVWQLSVSDADYGSRAISAARGVHVQ